MSSKISSKILFLLSIVMMLAFASIGFAEGNGEDLGFLSAMSSGAHDDVNIFVKAIVAIIVMGEVGYIVYIVNVVRKNLEIKADRRMLAERAERAAAAANRPKKELKSGDMTRL